MAGALHFLPSELDPWDDVRAQALVLTFFCDERPLRGAAGLVDWRLCGQLSRLLKRRVIVGNKEESVLMPGGKRLPFARVLLFGLGESRNFGEAPFRAAVRRVREVCNKATLSNYAIQPPGRATGLIAARRALELWQEESQHDSFCAQVTIVDTPCAHKEMADLLHVYQPQGPAPSQEGAQI